MFGVGTKAAGMYEITGVLGKGGAGTVYAVLDRNGKKHLAMKVCSGNRCLEDGKKEAELQKKLRHRKIPRVLDVFYENGAFCIVMEYRKGKTLEQLVRESGPLTEEETVLLGMELCRLLAFLHKRRRPVFYQDLKPSNLLMDQRHLGALVDFGCACEAGEDGHVRACGRGTKGYAAPEQFEAGAVLCAGADIYGLGCTLAYAVGGQKVSAELREVLLRCTSIREEERYTSVAELRRELVRCLPGKHVQKTAGIGLAVLLTMAGVTAGAVAFREYCYRQCIHKVQELLAEPPEGGNREELRRYFHQEVLPGRTCREILQREKQTYASLLFQMGLREWYEGDGTEGKRAGGLLCKEALETGALTEQEAKEAACYAGLIAYYSGEREQILGSGTNWEAAEAAMEYLWRLQGVLREEKRPPAEILETEAEVLRAAYELPVEELRKKEIRAIISNIKNDLKKEKEDFSGEQRERRNMLLEAAEELLRL